MILAPLLKEILKELIQKTEEKKENSTFPESKAEIPEIKIAVSPIFSSKENTKSRFSISAKLDKKEEISENNLPLQNTEELPNNHFTETDLQTEWKKFLEEIQKNDIVIYNAISGFQLNKVDENTICIHYPSDTAKAEFDKVSTDFFNKFKHKVNHFRIEIQYKNSFSKMKKEVVTKRTIFEKYVEINPVLKDLDDLFKFDFN